MSELKSIKRDIARLKALIGIIEYHLSCRSASDAREALREAQQVKIRIANRLCIENYIQTKSTRAMH